jgi:AcrR family transcriptional regulator
MVSSTSPTRGDDGKAPPRRREQILDVAIELFHQKGYHGTGMDEIGDAAGITGPGIYRHFKSKAQILDVGIRAAVSRSLENARRIVETTDSPEQALEDLIGNFVDGLLLSRAVSSVVMRERHALAPATRRWVDRAERLHVEEWVHVLSQLRTDLSDGEARMMVHAALWMCLSVTYYESGIDPAREGDVLKRMVRTSLLGTGPLPS